MQSDGLEQSLNLLKQLQNKLHIPKTNRSGSSKNANPYLHTQPSHYNPYQNNKSKAPQLNSFRKNQDFTIKKQIPENCYSFSGRQETARDYDEIDKNSSLPIMNEQNQNKYESIKQIIRENRRLKKYVNSLLQMNDYLKNQLIGKNQWSRNKTAQVIENNYELQLMKMQIEYQKELNREKQIDLKKSLYLGSSAKLKSKNKGQYQNMRASTDLIKARTKHNRTQSQQVYSSAQHSNFKTLKKIGHNKSRSNHQYPKSTNLCYHENQQQEISQRKTTTGYSDRLLTINPDINMKQIICGKLMHKMHNGEMGKPRASKAKADKIKGKKLSKIIPKAQRQTPKKNNCRLCYL